MAVVADAGGSLWNIHLYEAAMPLLFVCLWITLSILWSPRARMNRAKRRRQRQSERALIRKQRAW